MMHFRDCSSICIPEQDRSHLREAAKQYYCWTLVSFSIKRKRLCILLLELKDCWRPMLLYYPLTAALERAQLLFKDFPNLQFASSNLTSRKASTERANWQSPLRIGEVLYYLQYQATLYRVRCLWRDLILLKGKRTKELNLDLAETQFQDR